NMSARSCGSAPGCRWPCGSPGRTVVSPTARGSPGSTGGCRTAPGRTRRTGRTWPAIRSAPEPRTERAGIGEPVPVGQVQEPAEALHVRHAGHQAQGRPDRAAVGHSEQVEVLVDGTQAVNADRPQQV